MQYVVGKQHVIVILKYAAEIMCPFMCHQNQLAIKYVALIMNLRNAALVHYSESLPTTQNVAAERHMILQLRDVLGVSSCELFLLISTNVKK